MRTNHRTKTNRSRKSVTLGDFIVTVYDAYDGRRAPAIVQLALDRHLVVFRPRAHFAHR